MTLREREGDQPLPIKHFNAQDVQTAVVEEINKRRELGISRYGTALQPHNGRDGLRDLYEELLDAVMYTKQVMLERPTEREAVYRKIDAERDRQHKMWGEQNHPNFSDNIQNWLPKAWEAQRVCEDAFKNGKGSWGHILFEEVAETYEAKSEEHLKEEIIQVMAVCEAWLESIDRNHVDPQ